MSECAITQAPDTHSINSLSQQGRLTLERTIFQPLLALQVLTVRNSHLVQLPYLTGLTALNTVEFNNNLLTELRPLAFANLPKLRTVRLMDNALTTLPGDMFVNSSNVNVVDVRRNRLTHLPQEVFWPLRIATTIYLFFNSLESIPEGLLANSPLVTTL